MLQVYGTCTCICTCTCSFYNKRFNVHVCTAVRTVIKFRAACGFDLHTCNKLVTLWVSSFNSRQVYKKHQVHIRHARPKQVSQAMALDDSPASNQEITEHAQLHVPDHQLQPG